MVRKFLRSKKNRKGLSGVIATLFLIVLTLVLVAIVWGIVTGLTNRQLDKAESCFGTLDKIKIRSDFTCFNLTNRELLIGIERKDVKLDSLIIGISAKSGAEGVGLNSKSFVLSNERSDSLFVRYYNDSFGVALPGENEAVTYKVDLNSFGLIGNPYEIIIAPKTNGESCDPVDTLREIDSCSLFESG